MEQEPDFNERIGKAIDDVKDYLNLRLRLIQLNLAEKASAALANMISSLIAMVFLILFVLFGSFALSYWLGSILDSQALGFIIVAGFYLFIALLIQVFAKKSIRRKMMDSFISDFANEQQNQNHHDN